MGLDLLKDMIAAGLVEQAFAPKADLATPLAILCPIAIVGLTAYAAVLSTVFLMTGMFGVVVVPPALAIGSWGVSLATAAGCGCAYFLAPDLTGCVGDYQGEDPVCMVVCIDEIRGDLDDDDDRHEAMTNCIYGCVPTDGTCIDVCMVELGASDD